MLHMCATDKYCFHGLAGNVMEYSPYLIIGFLLTEYNELVSTATLSVFAVVLFGLRLAHGLQLAAPDSIPIIFRMAGTLSTIAALAVLGTLNLVYGLSSKN